MRKRTIIKAKREFKRIRMERGISRIDIAIAAGCSSAFIGMLENRETGIKETKAQKISIFFNLPFSDLFVIK